MNDRPLTGQRHVQFADGGSRRDIAIHDAMDANSDPHASRTDVWTSAASGGLPREKTLSGKAVSLLGLEPKTYGLKVRCSTN